MSRPMQFQNGQQLQYQQAQNGQRFMQQPSYVLPSQPVSAQQAVYSPAPAAGNWQPLPAAAVAQASQLSRAIPPGASSIQEVVTSCGEPVRVTSFPSLASGASALVQCPAIVPSPTIHVPVTQLVQHRKTQTFIWHELAQSSVPVSTTPTLSIVEHAPTAHCMNSCAPAPCAAGPCQPCGPTNCPQVNSVQRIGSSLSQANFCY